MDVCLTMRRTVIYILSIVAIFSYNKATGDLRHVQEKNYYLLTLMQQNKQVKNLLENDAVLSKLAKNKIAAIKQSITSAQRFSEVVESLTFTTVECGAIEKRLGELYYQSAELRLLVSKELVPSGTHIINNNLSLKDQFIKACGEDFLGINHTINVYGGGEKPNYPNIDSISYNVNDPAYLQIIKNDAQTIIAKDCASRLFFLTSMDAALLFLQKNGRDDAGNFEPMAKTINKAAVKKAKNLDWRKFAYSVLVVPGEGPDAYNEAISEGGKLRCRLAAQAYSTGIAPFILVSGGKVHPYKTTYCEAVEMKRYLMDSLHIAESAIIMDPHARHTTTNMRNAVRLIIHYHLDRIKPGLIVSDKADVDYIAQMSKRCIDELHIMPYRLGNRINDTGLEFYPLQEALQINSNEPLDP